MTYTSRIPLIARQLAIATDAAIVAGAHQVAKDAEVRLLPHRKTGALEQQIDVDATKRDGVFVVAGNTSDPTFAFWGMLLEHGTSHSAPAPFLVPALEENREAIVASVAAAIDGL